MAGGVYIAVIHIRPEIEGKIRSKHNLTGDEVRSTFVMQPDVSGAWEDHPTYGNMAAMQHGDPDYDWVDDDELSAAETLRRFAALAPTRVEMPAQPAIGLAATTTGGASTTFTEQLWPGSPREPVVS